MILVAGGLADSVTELVCARLNACGYDWKLLDLGRYPDGHGLSLRWTAAGPAGHVSGPDWRLDIGEISGVYVRFLGPDGRVPPPDLPAEHAAELQMQADAALTLLFEDMPCPVVNRIGGGMSNNSKPYQIQLIGRAGLAVPPTLVTSDPEAARAFHARHGQLIYKSASGIRSIVRRLGPEQVARLDLLRNGPAQFQALVAGDDIRVHTVGDALFATRVISEAVDYRYASRDGHSVEMEPVELPDAVAAACRRVARDLDLLHSGIDLKRTPDGEWFCFEVNPCPGFLYYERLTGQPISQALADLLHGSGTRPGRTADPETGMLTTPHYP